MPPVKFLPPSLVPKKFKINQPLAKKCLFDISDYIQFSAKVLVVPPDESVATPVAPKMKTNDSSIYSLYNNNLTKIYILTSKQPMEHSSPNAHAIRNSNRHAR